MLVYDKDKIKESLTENDIYLILEEFGGNPEQHQFGIVSATICHNEPGVGSKKLYYYFNSRLFQCYTGCANSSFDIFELVIKVAEIQWHKTFTLYDAMRWIAYRFGFSGSYEEIPQANIEDWQYLSNYERIQDINFKIESAVLKEYDQTILKRFNYNIKIVPWINEGITQEVMKKAKIGYYPGGQQITIPHFDKDGRFIGLRGRTLGKEEGEQYGKYRPLYINKILYSHPLGMNLYNLNNSKKAIKTMKKAIVFESEKSSLMFQSYFGVDNDISVACCGSSLSAYQIQLLIEAGAEEIIIAFDRQFKILGDDEFKKLKANLLKIRERYKNFVTISFIFDKKMITGYKSSPIDEGPEKFLQLFKERIIL